MNEDYLLLKNVFDATAAGQISWTKIETSNGLSMYKTISGLDNNCFFYLSKIGSSDLFVFVSAANFTVQKIILSSDLSKSKILESLYSLISDVKVNNIINDIINDIATKNINSQND